MTVTRIELLEHVESAFESSPVTREGLLQAARNSGAGPDVIAVLDRLPEKTFGGPRDLWIELPDVPINA